jgi:hypothetical protein
MTELTGINRGMTMNERSHLETLLTALDASPSALCRDECGDWHTSGRYGHVYADGKGWLIVVMTGESARRWTNVKQRLSPFCWITQDGDDEGALRLDHLPAQHQADLIREAIGVRRKRSMSPAALQQARSALEQARAA